MRWMYVYTDKRFYGDYNIILFKIFSLTNWNGRNSNFISSRVLSEQWIIHKQIHTIHFIIQYIHVEPKLCCHCGYIGTKILYSQSLSWQKTMYCNNIVVVLFYDGRKSYDEYSRDYHNNIVIIMIMILWFI